MASGVTLLTQADAEIQSVPGLFDIRRGLFEALDADTVLTAAQKRQVRRVLRFMPLRAVEVLKLVQAEAQDERMMSADGSVLVDWDKFLEFLMVLLPWLIELIG